VLDRKRLVAWPETLSTGPHLVENVSVKRQERTGLAEDAYCVTVHQHRQMRAQVADSFRGQPVIQVQCGSV
jgi:hypothetical protein